MKKIFILLIAAIFVFCSCKFNSRKEIDRLLQINDSILSTNEGLAKRNDSIYAILDKKQAVDKVSDTALNRKIQQTRQLTDELIAYIQKLSIAVITIETGLTEDEARTADVHKLRGLKHFEKPTKFLIGSEAGGGNGIAHELRHKLETYKMTVFHLTDSSRRKELPVSLISIEGPFWDAEHHPQNWEMYNFNQTLLAADIVIFNKLINDVLQLEYEAIIKF